LRATIVPQHRTSQTSGIAEAIDLKSTLLGWRLRGIVHRAPSSRDWQAPLVTVGPSVSRSSMLFMPQNVVRPGIA
jgi:hypothetical protein